MRIFYELRVFVGTFTLTTSIKRAAHHCQDAWELCGAHSPLTVTVPSMGTPLTSHSHSAIYGDVEGTVHVSLGRRYMAVQGVHQPKQERSSAETLWVWWSPLIEVWVHDPLWRMENMTSENRPTYANLPETRSHNKGTYQRRGRASSVYWQRIYSRGQTCQFGPAGFPP